MPTIDAFRETRITENTNAEICNHAGQHGKVDGLFLELGPSNGFPGPVMCRVWQGVGKLLYGRDPRLKGLFKFQGSLCLEVLHISFRDSDGHGTILHTYLYSSVLCRVVR